MRVTPAPLFCDWKGTVLRGVGIAPKPLKQKAFDESIIGPSKTPSKAPSKSPHKTAYRSTSLHPRSCAKSILTASLTRSVHEEFLPVRTVRRSASRSSAAISSGERYTVTGLSLLLPVGEQQESTEMLGLTDNPRILLANSNQWYFNNLVKNHCHKTHCRCPHRLNLSFQSSRSCALPNIKVLKDKDLEFANSITEGCETEAG